MRCLSCEGKVNDSMSQSFAIYDSFFVVNFL